MKKTVLPLQRSQFLLNHLFMFKLIYFLYGSLNTSPLTASPIKTKDFSVKEVEIKNELLFSPLLLKYFFLSVKLSFLFRVCSIYHERSIALQYRLFGRQKGRSTPRYSRVSKFSAKLVCVFSIKPRFCVGLIFLTSLFSQKEHLLEKYTVTSKCLET